MLTYLLSKYLIFSTIILLNSPTLLSVFSTNCPLLKIFYNFSNFFISWYAASMRFLFNYFCIYLTDLSYDYLISLEKEPIDSSISLISLTITSFFAILDTYKDFLTAKILFKSSMIFYIYPI